VRVILNYHVRCAEVEEAAYQIFGLEIRLQHSNELLFSFLGVDKILVVWYQLETFGELLAAILLTHVICKLFEVAVVEVDHLFIVVLSRRSVC